MGFIEVKWARVHKDVIRKLDVNADGCAASLPLMCHLKTAVRIEDHQGLSASVLMYCISTMTCGSCGQLLTNVGRACTENLMPATLSLCWHLALLSFPR